MDFLSRDQTSAPCIGISVAALLVGYVLWYTFAHPLSKYPGPFLASKSSIHQRPEPI
jgi:hypothetical protein